MIAEAVYLLCAVTCAICAGLLLRGYRRSGTRLLLWSGLCFIGLLINNVLLFLDLTMLPRMDLSTWRSVSALAGLSLLLIGLVWDVE